MLLTVDTNKVLPRLGDREGLALLKKIGFDGVDYTFCGLPDDHPVFGEKGLDYARDLRAYLDEIGLPCVQAHAPFDVEYGDPFDPSFLPYWQVIRSMEAAAVLGAKCIVVHAITVREASEQYIEDYSYKYYKTLEPYAEKFGIQIAVENLFNTDRKRNSYINRRCGTPEGLSRLLSRLNSPWFTACVDLGHAALTGYEPEEFLRALPKGTVTGLHVQDTDYRSDSHQLPFVGNQNWPEIMKALKEIGYEGTFNYELVSFLGKAPTELLPAFLTLAHDTGRYLTKLFEA